MIVYVITDTDWEPVAVVDTPATALRWARAKMDDPAFADDPELVISEQQPVNEPTWWLIHPPDNEPDYDYAVHAFTVQTMAEVSRDG